MTRFMVVGRCPYYMAQNVAETKIDCPRCGKNDQMKTDLDLKVSSNVTVLECPDYDCEHRFAKDQSVKISGSLVLEAADCMESLGGYSSLGEFVRETIRIRTAAVEQNFSALAFGKFLTVLGENPELMFELIKDDDEEEE